MSALLGHSDAARCMAKAFDIEADAMTRADPSASRTLFAISRAYDRAAEIMLAENTRQLNEGREK